MQKPTILIAMPIADGFRARLAERYTLFGPFPAWTPDSIPAEARNARAIVTRGALGASEALMAALPELGLICFYGSGFEALDRSAAARRNIRATHAQDANATAVAEFTLGLMLATGRVILQGDAVARAGTWGTLTVNRVPQVPGLAGRRLGIYGLGAIGQRVAQRAAPFEMEVGYHNRSPRPDLPYTYLPTLLALAEWADFLVVTVRATAENRHAVNAPTLRALGPQGIVINVARGIAIDTEALCDALETGTIAAAGLDVFEDEPRIPARLLAAPNTVLTPHIAAFSQAAQGAQQQQVLDNLEAFFAGKPLPSEVQ